MSNIIENTPVSPISADETKSVKLTLCRFYRTPQGCGKGKACGFHHPTNWCQEDKTGKSCRFGALCLNVHQADPVKPINLRMCRNFLVDRRCHIEKCVQIHPWKQCETPNCTRQNCSFLHKGEQTKENPRPEISASPIKSKDAMKVVCKYVRSGEGCWNGDDCKFVHPTRECFHLKSKGACPNGTDCTFIHTGDTLEKIAKPSKKAKESETKDALTPTVSETSTVELEIRPTSVEEPKESVKEIEKPAPSTISPEVAAILAQNQMMLQMILGMQQSAKAEQSITTVATAAPYVPIAAAAAPVPATADPIAQIFGPVANSSESLTFSEVAKKARVVCKTLRSGKLCIDSQCPDFHPTEACKHGERCNKGVACTFLHKTDRARPKGPVVAIQKVSIATI